MQKLVYTGERVIPELQENDPILAEHLLRYTLAGTLAREKVVADIACGSGYGTRMLAQAGAVRVYGIDRDAQTIQYAHGVYGTETVRFVVADALTLPLRSSSIDLVVSFETIEHLSDPKKFLEEAARVLKPDGQLLLSTPNKETYHSGNPFHTREFTLSEISGLLRQEFPHVQMLSQFAQLASVIAAVDHFNRHQGVSVPLRTLPFNTTRTEECLYSMWIASHTPMAVPETHALLFRPSKFLSWEEMFAPYVKEHLYQDSLQAQERTLQSLRQQLHAMTSSRSWKVTAPLRWLSRKFRAARARR